MFVETSNIDEAHCSQAQSISQRAVGNQSSESRMLYVFFLSFQEDVESAAEFYEKMFLLCFYVFQCKHRVKSFIYYDCFFSCSLNLKPVSSGLGVSQLANLKSEINLSSLFDCFIDCDQ